MAQYLVPTSVDRHQSDAYTLVGYIATNDKRDSPLLCVFADGRVAPSLAYTSLADLRFAGQRDYLERTRTATLAEAAKLAAARAAAFGLSPDYVEADELKRAAEKGGR